METNSTETAFAFYKRLAAEQQANADKLHDMYRLRKIKDGAIGDALWAGYQALKEDAAHCLKRMEESRVPA